MSEHSDGGDETPALDLWKVGAAVTGATILGIRRFNMARSELIETMPMLGNAVDMTVVTSLSGIRPTSRLVATAMEWASDAVPEPLAAVPRAARDAAVITERVVKLTGLDQPAPPR